MQMYEVGGCVRDELLGVKSKDIDFTVVLSDIEVSDRMAGGMTPFEVMQRNLRLEGFEIFLSTPEFLTVRARFPKGSPRSRLTADFVLARKESGYSDSRRPDTVEVGTLEDDLRRRDFTMNAIAKDSAGNLIDPFNGQADIEARVIRAVGNPVERIREDALRAVRAIRFSVTKGFVIDEALSKVINSRHVARLIEENISDERIQVELSKMFRFDTVHSLWILSKFPNLSNAMFAGKVSLDATMKQRNKR